MKDSVGQRQLTQIPASDLVAYDSWLASIDRSLATGWRWRRRGLIQPIEIFGRLYVSRRAIADFELRASRGEFSKDCKTPQRKAAEK
jgi:hypothetical protein